MLRPSYCLDLPVRVSTISSVPRGAVATTVRHDVRFVMMSRKRSGGSFGGKGVETVTTVYQQSENTGLESGKEDGRGE